MEFGAVVAKTLFRDIYDDLLVPNGSVYEKIEGLAVNSLGEVWINNDNDGVNDNSGEQQLINLGQLIVGDEEVTAVPAAAPTTSASASMASSIAALFSVVVAAIVA
jgi:hypothetical protein